MTFSPHKNLSEIVQIISTLRQLAQHIECIRQDFMEGAGPALPNEVTQFHLRRELVSLERQIKEVLFQAFGEQSVQVRQFQALKFTTVTTPAHLQEGLLALETCIGDLEQQRLHMTHPAAHPQHRGIDDETDLYTGPVFRRYLEHEMAWSQRFGEPFAILLLRLARVSQDSSYLRRSTGPDVAMILASVLKSTLRGHDLPGRLGVNEFGVIVRHADRCEVTVVAERVMANLQSTSDPRLPKDHGPVEFSCAVYPYDGETAEGLLVHAQNNWTAFEPDHVAGNPDVPLT